VVTGAAAKARATMRFMIGGAWITGLPATEQVLYNRFTLRSVLLALVDALVATFCCRFAANFARRHRAAIEGRDTTRICRTGSRREYFCNAGRR